LTWKFGHIKYDSGDRFLEIYRQHAAGMNIKDWILQKYPDVTRKKAAERSCSITASEHVAFRPTSANLMLRRRLCSRL
jgi:hypothetical protein